MELKKLRVMMSEVRIEMASIEAARKSGLLDSPPELAFDRLTRLTAQMLKAPVSVVTILDEGRQFFKSHFGMGEPLCSVRQTPLSHSFCKYVVSTSQPLVVRDAREEEPFCSIPTGPSVSVVAYLGVPLLLKGVPFGALCVVDHKPRDWSDEEVEMLTDMAQAVISEVELREAAERLREAYAWLAEMMERQKQFIGMAAHDLRTPLTVILGYGKLLGSERFSLPPVQKKMVDAIYSRGEFMLSLVNDLLDFEALKWGYLRLDIEEISVVKFLRKKIELNRILAEPKGISLRLDIPEEAADWPILWADRRKLEQVFNNLLSNAIKYSVSDTSVTVQARRDKDHVIFVVSDQGFGIAPSRLECLFEPFRRGASHGEKGTGLGLAIVKKIVEGHLGTVSVSSEEGKGSTFTVRLPFQADFSNDRGLNSPGDEA